MGLLIIGVILLVVLSAFKSVPNFPLKSTTPIRIVAIGLIIIGLLSATIVQIGSGEVGVPVLFGKVNGQILNSGLNVVNPLCKVEMFDVKTQNYTMSAVHDEGERVGDDAIRILSSDGLEVTMDITVLYRLSAAEAPRMLREIGADMVYKDKVVRPITRTKIRDNAVYYTAIDLYSVKREEFQSRIFTSIEKDFKQRGLILEQLLVRNISLPESVKLTIESKINAEQESQKMQFVLQKEKQEAERKRVEAQGIADYQRIISLQLTDKQLQYEMIKAYQELAKSANAKTIILGNSKSPVILDGK
ncbi:MAG: prohibitin family protein [Sphingobacteriales bacterium]|jgi:regulator of protease activity HflC (stomatin/prohibitin superfamily)|nr:prohibitin family protein [Sphingobacteriales bacterium]